MLYTVSFIEAFSHQDLGAINACSNCPALSTWKTALRQTSDPLWYRPTTLSQVFEIFSAHVDAVVQLVCGDTGKGEGAFLVLAWQLDHPSDSRAYLVRDLNRGRPPREKVANI